MVQSRKDQNIVRTFTIHDQSHEFSSLESMNNQGKDVIKGMQPRFVYHSTFLDYYEPLED
jgi:hypothetical protein